MSAGIDLRDQSFTIPAPPEPTPQAAQRPDPLPVLRRRRRLVVLGLIAVVAVLLAQHLCGVLMADQRQRHLANELLTPDSDIGAGEAAMLVQIPEIGMNLVVAEGASSSELRGGPGRVIGSARVADGGNVVVLGRKLRFGAPFGRLDELAVGTPIVVRDRGGMIRSYTVSAVERVPDDDAGPLANGQDRLTLITRGPGWLADDRLVVVAGADAPVTGPVADPETDPGTEAAPAPGTEAAALSTDSLDERSTGAVGLLLGLVLLVASGWALLAGFRRLAESYRWVTVAQVVIPIGALILVVSFIIGDSLLPTTL